jgi:hypothetical protein
MNKRLIWNFEINFDQSLDLTITYDYDRKEDRWEARYFWPDDQIITLKGLDQHFLELSRYEIKHRQDTYYLLPQSNYNIKMRRGQIFYKPLLMQQNNAIAYGKKIALEEQAAGVYLPGCHEQDARSLLDHIQSKGIALQVEKEALLYTFPTIPKTKLELTWLHIGNKGYYSLCIESRSVYLVEFISSQIVGNELAIDYVSFLKGTQTY